MLRFLLPVVLAAYWPQAAKMRETIAQLRQ
jgi:hypothetical protein